MGFLNKVASIPTALGKKQKFNKPSITVTTNDFFYLKPVYSRELMPNQSTDINMSLFCRMASMPNPAYARIKFVNRAFFVRYDQVFRGFKNFLAQTKTASGVIPSTVPSFKQFQIFDMFGIDSEGSELFCTVSDPGAPYDISVGPTEDRLTNFKFTKRGKVVYDILINLGYNIPRHILTNPDSGMYGDWNVKYSALPLLAYAKVWFDWFKNNKYEPITNAGKPLDYFFDFNYGHEFTASELYAILECVTRTSYDIDYYTSVSARPVGSSIDSPSQTVEDITTLGNHIHSGEVDASVSAQTNQYQTPQLEPSNDGSTNSITDYLLKVVNKMTDFMVRDGLVGGSTLDRLLVHYGVRVPSVLLTRSIYLGKYEQPMTIMDVTQTSGSADPSSDAYTQLGYQGGRGLSAQQTSGHFHFDTNNDIFGQMIIISQIVPEISYYQGVKREMLHIERFDFFTPEYDSLGQQLMHKCEVYNGVSQFNDPLSDPITSENSWDDGFGFTDRYGEYKQSDNQDVCSGDFRVKTAGMKELQSYQLFRQIYAESFKSGNATKLVTNEKFDTVNADAQQFDRMFNWASDFDDHFISFYDFQVTDFLPCRPMFESFDFGDDEEHNKRVHVQKGGTMF